MTAARRRPGRPRGSTRDPQERHDELLRSAEATIREHGPGVSMEQIAERASVSKATLYDNFDGKAGLTAALVDRYGARVLSVIAQGLDEPVSAHQVLRGGIEVFVSVIERDAQLYRFVLAGGANQTMLDESAAPVATLLAAALAQVGADTSGTEVLSRAVLGGIFAAAEQWAASPTTSRADFVDQLDALFWPGLAAAGLDRLEGPVDLRGIAELIRTSQGRPAASVGAGPDR